MAFDGLSDDLLARVVALAGAWPWPDPEPPVSGELAVMRLGHAACRHPSWSLQTVCCCTCI
eukprot:24574-Chlamydomonas_euryale.AAC.3